jgi:amidohydrolase
MPATQPGSRSAVEAPVEIPAAGPDLAALIQQELPTLIALRRELHAMPELSNQERWTGNRIREELTRLGIPFRPSLGGGEGIVAHLPATEPGERPAVGLRADMDALPILEQTGLDYASRCPGVMHACGHDGHMTCVLGAARVLARLGHRPNPVTFIFQPAEEDGGGAEKMCEAGALGGEPGGALGPPIGRIYGLHCWPTIEVGRIGTRPGPLMAATDDFILDIIGVQGHAAQPHMCRDPIVAAAAIVTALQTMVSRSVAPQESMVCTVGQFIAGTANNIIPETARLVGTIRTLSASARAIACQRFFEIVQGVAAAHGCRPRIDWMPGYPVTENDEGETERVFDIASQALGREHVVHIQHPTMGGEDFAYYGQHVPACFLFLGTRPRGVEHSPALHQPDFDFNDEAIGVGVKIFCRLALAE